MCVSLREYDATIYRLYTHLDKVEDVLFPALKQTGDIRRIHIDDPGPSEMCPLLVRTDFEGTEVDEPAVGNRIRHQVLRDKHISEKGMEDTLGK
jgi:hypothetical protein